MSPELSAEVARLAGYAALAVFIGGLLFLALIWPAGANERRTHRLLVTATGLGLVAAVASALLLVHRLKGGITLDDLPNGPLTEDVGRPYAVLVLLWVLAATVVVGAIQGGEAVVRGLPWRAGALVVAAGLLRITAMNAHAGETPRPFWEPVADFLHLTGVSAWAGGLVLILACLLPGRSPTDLQQALPRFSRVALFSVIAIVASGLVLVWQVLGDVDALWSTHDGRVLLVKLALFALVMLAALNSRRWVNKCLHRALANSRATDRSGAVRYFAVSVAAESVLVVAVLRAVSVLTTSSPGI